jgi:hypothetical protein
MEDPKETRDSRNSSQSIRQKREQDSSREPQAAPPNLPKPDLPAEESVEVAAMVTKDGKSFTRILISEKSKDKAGQQALTRFAVSTEKVARGQNKMVIPRITIFQRQKVSKETNSSTNKKKRNPFPQASTQSKKKVPQQSIASLSKRMGDALTDTSTKDNKCKQGAKNGKTKAVNASAVMESKSKKRAVPPNAQNGRKGGFSLRRVLSKRMGKSQRKQEKPTIDHDIKSLPTLDGEKEMGPSRISTPPSKEAEMENETVASEVLKPNTGESTQNEMVSETEPTHGKAVVPTKAQEQPEGWFSKGILACMISPWAAQKAQPPTSKQESRALENNASEEHNLANMNEQEEGPGLAEDEERFDKLEEREEESQFEGEEQGLDHKLLMGVEQEEDSLVEEEEQSLHHKRETLVDQEEECVLEEKEQSLAQNLLNSVGQKEESEFEEEDQSLVKSTEQEEAQVAHEEKTDENKNEHEHGEVKLIQSKDDFSVATKKSRKVISAPMSRYMSVPNVTDEEPSAFYAFFASCCGAAYQKEPETVELFIRHSPDERLTEEESMAGLSLKDRAVGGKTTRMSGERSLLSPSLPMNEDETLQREESDEDDDCNGMSTDYESRADNLSTAYGSKAGRSIAAKSMADQSISYGSKAGNHSRVDDESSTYDSMADDESSAYDSKGGESATMIWSEYGDGEYDGDDMSQWEVLSVFDLPEMHEDAASVDEKNLAAIAEGDECSEKTDTYIEDKYKSVDAEDDDSADMSQWEVLSVFDLPQMHEDAESVDEKSLAAIAEDDECSEKTDNYFEGKYKSVDARDNDSGAEEDADKRVDEALAALKVFRKHAKRLGIDERDLFRAVHKSYNEGDNSTIHSN